MTRKEAVVHKAGEMVDGLQVCVDCGAVLADYRNAMWPADDPPPRGWEEGVFVLRDGSYHAVVHANSGTRRCKEMLQ
jgi:hypothetical protein